MTTVYFVGGSKDKQVLTMSTLVEKYRATLLPKDMSKWQSPSKSVKPDEEIYILHLMSTSKQEILAVYAYEEIGCPLKALFQDYFKSESST